MLRSRITPLSPRLPFTRLNLVCRELARCAGKTVLDLGCGDGQAMKLVAQAVGDRLRITGVDAFPVGIRTAGQQGVYEALVLANVLALPFKDKSFDLVVLCEVLEHMPKEAGGRLLSSMEAIAREAVIVTTPAYLDRERQGTEAEDAAFQCALHREEPWKIPHIAIWSRDEYRRFGYRVRGANGLHLSRLPRRLGLGLGITLAPLACYLMPDRAHHIVAVKKLREESHR